MTDSVKQRRQSRGKATKSYRVEEQYKFLDSDDESSQQKPAPARPSTQDDGEDSDTFMPEAQDDEEEEEVMDDVADEDVDMEEDDVGTPEGSSRAGSVASRADYAESDTGTPPGKKKRQPAKCDVGAISTSGAEALYRGRRTLPTPRAKPKDGQAKVVQKKNPEQMLKRGIDEWGRGARGGGLENRVKDLFGPSKTDLEPILKTKDFWLHQNTLPSREDSLRTSFYHSEEAREREIQKLRDWYSNSGSESFSHGQKTKALTPEEAQVYLLNGGPDSINLLIGETRQPHLYKLKRQEFMSTATPFESKEDRRGWVINLGSKVRDAQWALNEEGSTQYVAVAVDQKQKDIPPLANPDAPAFTATEGYPSSIQIWGFQSTEDGMLDPTNQPNLELVICTEWGAPKQLRWCPYAVTDSAESEDGSCVRLGLLASIWSDGRVRVLDISIPKRNPVYLETHHLLYTRCAFEIELPHTVPSCLHWLSGTSIAVATAAGIVGAWTLTRPDAFPPANHDLEKQYNPPPWFYRQLADTFILSLSSGFPSRSTYISITTADGYSKMIDLRSPAADTASTNRGRIFGLTQAWHEHTQSFLMSDEIHLLRSNTIRRYYSNIHNMRSEAQIVCCATSPVHPGVLIASSDGVVTCSNPLARVLNYKEIPWQQIWFTHEWRPPVDKLPLKVKRVEATSQVEEDDDDRTDFGEDEDEDEEPAPNAVPSEIVSQPLSRITEGYRVQQTALQPVKPGANPHSKDFIKPIAIHEEPTCITTVAWNPNLKFGTWAVAGMGDGLLRVEDVGV